MKENENCTYLYDKAKRILYISLSFENLNNLNECKDWFEVDIDKYKPECEEDTIQELIDEVTKED